MPRPRFRVLVADARPSLRLGLQRVLEREGFDVVAQAGTLEEAVAAAVSTRPDACLIDAGLRGGGLESARRIRARLPESEIVMITDALSEEELLQALRAGASGYVVKRSEPERFAMALRSVLSGEAFVPRALLGGLIDALPERDVRRPQAERHLGVRFTAREWQVIDRLLHGLTTEEVAGQLAIAAVTVRRHVSAVVRKLGVPDRDTALARLAEAVPPPPGLKPPPDRP
jgi:DNA-binding NarL/FixJ family response regulator